jgi:hypothetical protein
MLSRDRSEGELVIHRLSRLYPNRPEFQDLGMSPCVGMHLGNDWNIHSVVVDRVTRISAALLETTSPVVRRSIQTYIDMHIPLINANMTNSNDLSDVYSRQLAPEQNAEYPICYNYYKRWHANVVQVWHPVPDTKRGSVNEFTKFLSKGGHMPPSARHIAEHMITASRDATTEPLVRDILLATLLSVLPKDTVDSNQSYEYRSALYAASTESICLKYLHGKTSRNVVDTICRFIAGCTYQSSVLVRSLRQCPIKRIHYANGLDPSVSNVRRARCTDVQRFSGALVFDALCIELNTTRKLPGRVTSSLTPEQILTIMQIVLDGPPGACVYKETLLRAGCSKRAVCDTMRAILPCNILFRTKGIKVKLPNLSNLDWSTLFICVKTQQRRMSIRIECAHNQQTRRYPIFTNICANCFTFRSLIPNLMRITKRTIGVVSHIDDAGTPKMACNSCKTFSIFTVDMASQQVKINGKTKSSCYMCKDFVETTLFSDVPICVTCKESVVCVKRPACKCGKPYSDKEGCLYTYESNQRSPTMAYLCKEHQVLFIGRHYTFNEHVATNKLVCASRLRI